MHRLLGFQSEDSLPSSVDVAVVNIGEMRVSVGNRHVLMGVRMRFDACAFDGKTKLCVGCFRTLDEIRGWKKMTDHWRYQVINDRARRQAKLQRESSALTSE
jgi:predicted Fe-S protein YdhL (DUF1289 family)